MTKEGREESKSGSDTELMYKEILASAGIGSWIMDLNTGIVTGCGEFRSILGLREHTTDRALIIQRVLPEFRDELIKAAMHGLKGLPMVVELPLDTQNGLPYIWTRVLGKVKFSQSGKRMAMVGMIENITEWKDKDQNKDDIISYLNHELRTPLTSLRLYIQRAARSAKQEGLDGINKLLGKADQQITSMQRLTESYLEFTSGEDGSITLDISSFDLYSYLESVILEYQFQYPEYRFKLSCPKNLCLLADLEKLNQVISNLLNNAIKYSPKRTIIDIDVLRQSENVMISVKDHGLGIEKPDVAKLFDRFFRAASQRETRVHGYGIGLHLVKKIVSAHKGQIAVNSCLGFGSEFYFTLPIDLP